MEKIEVMFAEISSKLQTMDTKLEKITDEVVKLRKENDALRERVTKQDKQIELLEREARRNNLIIHGVTDDENERMEGTEHKVVEIIKRTGVDIAADREIDDARRMGRYREGNTRPIQVKLTRGNKKAEILKQARNLKGTDIWIDQDYPKEILEQRKELIPKLKEAREKGNKATLKYNKLIINGKVYNPREQQLIPTSKDGNERKGDNKRTTSQRSPGNESFEEQLNKIARKSKN